MKNFYLPVLGLALVAGTASAQTAQVLEHQCILRVSPNGKWAVSEDAMFKYELNIIDLEKGEIVAGPFSSEDYSYISALGNAISNSGIVLGAENPFESKPQYFENGEWKVLPTPEKAVDQGGFTMGITADGSRICGYVDILEEGYEYPTSHPCVWYRNADGSYAQPIILPEPTIDFTGRKAQHTLVHYISEDGKKISGLFTDYSGMIHQPIVYTEGADGTWTYELLFQEELYRLSEVEFPQFTIEEPEYVDYTDFMSEESKAALEQAEADYYAGILEEYPVASQYMTPEELAAYEAASDEYDRLSDLYWTEYAAFAEVFEPYMGTIPLFEMNMECMSTNGKYMLANSFVLDPNGDPFAWPPVSLSEPYVFNLEAGTMSKHLDPKENITALQIINDGTILGVNKFSTYNRDAYILLPGATEYLPLKDYLTPISAEFGKWMDENMIHDVPVYQMDEEGNYVYDEFYNLIVDHFEPVMFVGQPQASDDLSVIATWVYNTWEEYSDDMIGYYSYVFKTGGQDGVEDVFGDGETVVLKGQKGGVIAVQGAVQSLKVYDLNGREVFSADEVGATVNTGLAQGVYVANAVDANGEVVVAKLAL